LRGVLRVLAARAAGPRTTRRDGLDRGMKVGAKMNFRQKNAQNLRKSPSEIGPPIETSCGEAHGISRTDVHERTRHGALGNQPGGRSARIQSVGTALVGHLIYFSRCCCVV